MIISSHSGKPLHVFLGGVTGFALGILFFILALYNLVYFVCGYTAMHTQDFGKLFNTTTSLLNGRYDGYINSFATLVLISRYKYCYLFNMNPPHFHILLIPISFFNIYSAFYIWTFINFMCLIISLILIIKETRIKITFFRSFLIFFGVLIFASTVPNLLTGQLSFLLLLPFTLAWIAARRGNWLKAGVWMGILMSVKLFLLIYLPYLVLKRQYRAAAVACLSAALCFGCGLLVFGWKAQIA